MNSLRFFVVLLLAGFSFASAGFAQKTSNPTVDFSGTWKLTKMTDRPSAMLPARKKVETEIQLVITQSGETINVRRETRYGSERFVREQTFYTDGRGEKNLSDSGKVHFETKTTIKKSKLITDGSARFVDSDYKSRKTEEWQMSSDGKTLTIEIKQYLAFDKDQLRGITLSPEAEYSRYNYVFERIP